MQFCKGYNVNFLVEAQVIPIFTHNYVNQLDKKNRNAQLQTKNAVESPLKTEYNSHKR